MKTVSEMALEACAGFYIDNTARVPAHWKFTPEQLKALVEIARADEREACARLCDARVLGDNNREDMEAKRCAADIRSFRARSDK